MTATENRKDADIRAALGLLIEARRLIGIHGYEVHVAICDLLYNELSRASGVNEFPVDVVPATYSITRDLHDDDSTLAGALQLAMKGYLNEVHIEGRTYGDARGLR